MLVLDPDNGDLFAATNFGRVVFRPSGLRQRDLILEFNPGAGAAALPVCKSALAALFNTTDTLIVRGYIVPENMASRMFSSALGMSTIRVTHKHVEKRITKARWRHVNG